MSNVENIPVQDVYSVSNLVDCLGYTRQSISKAIREVCPDAKKGKRGYELDIDEVRAIASHFSIAIDVDDATQQEPSCELDLVKATIEVLQNQLTEKDKQIAELNATISELLQTNKALSANATMITAKELKESQQETLDVPAQPKTFFEKLRGLFQ